MTLRRLVKSIPEAVILAAILLTLVGITLFLFFMLLVMILS